MDAQQIIGADLDSLLRHNDPIAVTGVCSGCFCDCLGPSGPCDCSCDCQSCDID
ncbi:hypothetical protein HY546_02925 [archaeon]|nr:hypothetical protein [archaeon]